MKGKRERERKKREGDKNTSLSYDACRVSKSIDETTAASTSHATISICAARASYWAHAKAACPC